MRQNENTHDMKSPDIKLVLMPKRSWCWFLTVEYKNFNYDSLDKDGKLERKLYFEDTYMPKNIQTNVLL